MLLNEILNIKHPVILAPMFLVTNVEMVRSAIDAGATGALVAHNYRTSDALRNDIRLLKKENKKPFGVNIVLDFANELNKENLEVCIEERVDFLITSLGDPGEIIKRCKPKEIKVFCDVVNEKHAAKVAGRGADAIIAVNNRAGGHAGALSVSEIVPTLIEKFEIPVISAGGVVTNEQYKKVMDLGAAGVSVGSAFIATNESKVPVDYKEAVINGVESDIVLTSRISGVPSTVINNEYFQSLSKSMGWLERRLKKRKRTKRLVQKAMSRTGLGKYQHKIVGPDYAKVYSAGPSIQDVHKETSVREVIERIVGNV
jgi:nitronate monooxygenase